MVFPRQGLVDYLISVAIQPSKVEYLAIALFKAHIELVGGVRYLLPSKGATLLPNPKITLKGVKDDAIVRVFSPIVYGATTTSRIRKKELEEGKFITKCMLMILLNNPTKGAIINLSLSVKGGSEIQNKLYPT
jgi:hypothetical protein